MGLMIVKKPFCSGKELLNRGDKFNVENGQGLIHRGYARRLNRDEAQEILSQYVEYANEIFSKVPQKETIQRVPKKTIEQERLF